MCIVYNDPDFKMWTPPQKKKCLSVLDMTPSWRWFSECWHCFLCASVAFPSSESGFWHAIFPKCFRVLVREEKRQWSRVQIYVYMCIYIYINIYLCVSVCRCGVGVMYIYTYIYIYMYVYVYMICLHIGICIYVCIYVCMYNICTCIYIYIYVCMYKCMYIYICIYVCINVCIYIYIHMCVCVDDLHFINLRKWVFFITVAPTNLLASHMRVKSYNLLKAMFIIFV